MKTNTQIIAEFLESHRTAKGISIYQVAKLTGGSQSYLGRVFSGQNKPSGEMFIKIGHALGLTKKDIFLLLSKINFPDNLEK